MPNPADVAAAMKLLGFDPASVQAVVLTPDSAVAIAADYPEPLDPPQGEPTHEEVPDGH